MGIWLRTRNPYQLVGHYVSEGGVLVGSKGKVELKDPFYLTATGTSIFGNRLISFVPQWAVLRLTLFRPLNIDSSLHFAYLRGNVQ